MLSTRLRRLIPTIPFVALAVALAAATPSFAADSMRILSPLSGTTVSGEVLVEGTISTATSVELTVGIAEQSLGDCGPLVAERTATVAANTAFSFTMSTQLLSDGVYCFIALADGGALSHVVGDITLANGIDDFGDLQLPTLGTGDSAEDSTDGDADTATVAAEEGPFAGISALAPVVFAAVAVLAMLVLVFVNVARRRLTE